MKLRDITTKQTFKDALKRSLVTKNLISLVPDKGLQKELSGLLGCELEKMAEYVVASILGFKVTDQDGSDFIKGSKKSECKFTVVNETIGKSSYTSKKTGVTKEYEYTRLAGSVTNLKTKNCDLHVLVCNPFDKNEYFALYSIPRNVWKQKWKGKSTTILIPRDGKEKKLWYLNYKVRTWKIT